MPFGPRADVAEDVALVLADHVVGLGKEHRVGPLDLADPGHHPGGEIRRRAVMDDRGLPLRRVERVHEPEAELLVVGQRSQQPVGRGLGAEHARGGRDPPAPGHGEVERHVMPGRAASPRPRSPGAPNTRKLYRSGLNRSASPGGSARSTCSMAITETTLVYPGRLVPATISSCASLRWPSSERADRQAVTLRLRQERPVAPLVAEGAARPPPLRLRSAPPGTRPPPRPSARPSPAPPGPHHSSAALRS